MGRSSWGRVGREIPVTRFKDMEEGGGYPMAREDRERPLSRGKEALRAIVLSRLGGEIPPVIAGVGTGLGWPPWGHWSHQGQNELTYLPTKEEGDDLWRMFAAQRAGALLRTGDKEEGMSLTLQIVPSNELEKLV